MLKISKKTSLNISIVLAILFLFGCVAGIFLMPYYINVFISARNLNHPALSYSYQILVHILGYCGLTVTIIAGVLLLFILLRVKHGLVFTSITVSLIRGVSWCCITLGIVLGIIGTFYFQLGLPASFAAVFLGICLRVVKNVIEEATLIKSENDLTV